MILTKIWSKSKSSEGKLLEAQSLALKNFELTS